MLMCDYPRFYKWENWDLERYSNLSRDTHYWEDQDLTWIYLTQMHSQATTAQLGTPESNKLRSLIFSQDSQHLCSQINV